MAEVLTVRPLHPAGFYQRAQGISLFSGTVLQDGKAWVNICVACCFVWAISLIGESPVSIFNSIVGFAWKACPNSFIYAFLKLQKTFNPSANPSFSLIIRRKLAEGFCLQILQTLQPDFS